MDVESVDYKNLTQEDLFVARICPNAVVMDLTRWVIYGDFLPAAAARCNGVRMS